MSDFVEKSSSALSNETVLAIELWRTRGCPEGGMLQDVQLAKEIIKSGGWAK